MAIEEAGEEDGALEEVLAEYLDRLNSGEMLHREEIEREHPDMASEILERLEVFQKMGAPVEAGAALSTLGDYRLIRRVGRGGMGVVYEAWQDSMDRRVALKVLPGGLLADLRAIARFEREARIAGKLQHPSIVGVHGMGVDSNTPYFVMEFVEGETLAQVVDRLKDSADDAQTPFGGRYAQQFYFNVAEAFAGVADGLQFAHSKGVIHRDIKPSNLILDREGRVRILDFGLARLEGQESLTLTGDCVGTMLYMSPEQARRKKVPIDHRTDVYSLGVTLYQLLTWRPPFRGKDHEDTLSKIIERDPVKPRSLNPRVPKDLETIVLKCLRKDRSDRYGTAEALAQDLRRFVRGDAIEARPQAGWERLARRLWRQKGLLVAGLFVFLFLLAAGLVVQNYYQEARKRSDELYEQSVLGAIMKLQVGQMLISTESGLDPSIDPFRFFTRADARVTSGGGGLEPVVKALVELEQAIAVFPGRPDAHYQRARALLLLGEEAKALQALDEAVLADGGFIPAKVLRAVLRETSGDPGIAGGGAGGGGAASSSSLEEAWRAAYVGTLERRWKEAAEAYSRILRLQGRGRELYLGSTLEARLGRGYALLETKDYLRCLEDFTTATALRPDFVEPVLLKGKAYHLMSDHALAEATFEEAHRNAPFPDEVARVLAIVHGQQFRDFEKALVWAERVEDEGVRETTRAACLNMVGRYDEALAAGRRAVELDPKNVQATIHLGTTLFFLARLKDAGELFRRAIALDPMDPRPYVRLGYSLSFQGKDTEGLVELQKAVDRNPGYVGARCGMIEGLSNLGRFGEAMTAAEDALKRSPKSSNALLWIAALLRQTGRYAEAAERLQQAQELDPGEHFVEAYWGMWLASQGKLDEAFSRFRQATERGKQPDGRSMPCDRQWYHCLAARVLELQGHLGEAFREYCVGIENGPYSAWEQKILPALLIRLGDSPGTRNALDRLAEKLETFLDQDYPQVLQTLALAHLHGERNRDLKKAHEYIQKARERDGSEDPAIASLLAEYHFQSGRREQSVLTLEEALSGPAARCYMAVQLAEYRRAILPDLASYASIDAALDSLKSREGGEAKLLEEFRAVAKGDATDRRISYLDARLVERSGDPSGAARMLRGLRALDPQSPDIVLRLARSLRAAGEPRAAADELQKALEKVARAPREMWELWAAISLVDLDRAPAEVLSDCPLVVQQGLGADLRWLLERLKTGEAIRIDCGSAEDRFFSGGKADRWQPGDVKETEDDALYQTARSFPEDQHLPAGYRVPLPKGFYRVTLHLAEVNSQWPLPRRFDVLIEGKEVLKAYAPLLAKGFATADPRSFDAEVSDGLLSIEFVHRDGAPMVSAIEIQKID